jgi:hypothetical protein
MKNYDFNYKKAVLSHLRGSEEESVDLDPDLPGYTSDPSCSQILICRKQIPFGGNGSCAKMPKKTRVPIPVGPCMDLKIHFLSCVGF